MSQAEDLKPHGKMGDAHKDYSKLTRADEPDTREQDVSKAEAMAHEGSYYGRERAAEKRQIADIYDKYSDRIEELYSTGLSYEESEAKKEQLTKELSDKILEVARVYHPMDQEDYQDRGGEGSWADPFAPRIAEREADTMLHTHPSTIKEGERYDGADGYNFSETMNEEKDASRREYWAGVLHEHPVDVEPWDLVNKERSVSQLERLSKHLRELVASADRDFDEKGYDPVESSDLYQLIGEEPAREYFQRKKVLMSDRSSTIGDLLELRKEAYSVAAEEQKAAAESIKEELKQIEEGTYKPE